MFEVVKISLENPMDLVLAHKKASRLSERLNLTMSTTTTFSTAVSEISREVIDRTDSGILTLGLVKEDVRYSLTAKLRFDKSIVIVPSDSGYQYALKLVPQVSQYSEGNCEVIELKISIPRSNKISVERINSIKDFFDKEPPYTAYEAIKLKNLKLQEQAEEKEEELQQSIFDNEQKIEFISIASHELKTPVTIIRAFAQLALASGGSECSEKVQKHLARIEAQSVKLTSLIQQLMDVSKMERGRFEYKLEKVNLTEYLVDTLDVIKHTVPNHTLDVSIKANVSVDIDKLRIEQVFNNVIGNAAKYSSKNSKITILCRIEDRFAIISVKDEGIGMSKENVSKIFDKFHRNSDVVNKFSGLGMGLYITSKILKEHNGEVWVESEEGIGSTFHFSLPIINPNEVRSTV